MTQDWDSSMKSVDQLDLVPVLVYPFVIKIGTSECWSKLGHIINVHEIASASTASSVPEACDFCLGFNEGFKCPNLHDTWVCRSLSISLELAWTKSAKTG